MTAEPVGIGAVHCTLPGVRQKTCELPELANLGHEQVEFVTTSGIETVGLFEDHSAGDLAAEACRELLADHPVDADVLILVGPRAPDVLLGSDATRVQAEAKLPGTAFTLDGLGCSGSSAAWGLARDLLLADPSRRGVIIAHGSRPTGLDRVRFPVTIIGDGGYAMSIVPGGRPVLRAHRIESDGAFHDLFTVDYRRVPWYEWREVCTSPDRYRFELAMQSRTRFVRLVDDVLADAGVTRDEVRTVLMQNVTVGAYQFYEALLGLPIHPICAAHLRAYGHLGAMDVVLNLSRLTATTELTEGDLVIVLNNSPVAAWAVTLWEI
ncbi:3-oxoacyl-[acyl-carrier-protein] synthase III C-terminal domain-containing protein [Plantactinospora sp. KBS50]|uniref:3-oxoacyl-[acyl-carrier-protein] synthase III C-terminal domain-containing protein n=1 Tax=Plantactinospora sp. KBS50 TaxID=2024580 RepID=UPI000BAB09F3|nr:3-oxoacyl-[acyl-carrier-protein] synthase III C-terminal domain-containing protein [Plantactinospora sp. KBS50]ASW54767.1 3-oxoacyl-ACP synthase [Plantactinospora sp. KBS50]